MGEVIEHKGMRYVCLEKLAYGHHSSRGMPRKELFHDVYTFHNGKPCLFARGHVHLRSEQEEKFIMGKLKLGLLYALDVYVNIKHSQYWERGLI